ncbi:MAG: hypothetical protein MUE97_07055 [Phycisphaerales bacterium]|jgi:hypothetical protein|nr:hypothetical protein [Phycisphaerales bacterium]
MRKGMMIVSCVGVVASVAMLPGAGRQTASDGEAGSVRPVFEVVNTTGSGNGPVWLKAVRANGVTYTDFIFPKYIWDAGYNGGPGAMRVVRGTANGNFEGLVKQHNIKAPGTDGPTGKIEDMDGNGSSVTQADVDGFKHLVLAALGNQNLNYLVDMQGEPTWHFNIAFEKPIKDDNPEPDGTPELIFFERGAGGGNSWITMQLVDANGQLTGKPVAFGSADGVKTNEIARVGTFDNNLRQTGTQEMTGVAIDLSVFGVTQAHKIQIRHTRDTDTTTRGNRWPGGERQPDWKIMAVQTYDVQKPATNPFD